MKQVGGAFVRLRPALAPEDDEALARLADTFRHVADELDTFRSHFVTAEPEAPVVQELPLRLGAEASIPIRFALEGGTT